MILYSPMDGDALTSKIALFPLNCFLMTRLGAVVPPLAIEMRSEISRICQSRNFSVIDAQHRVTGRDLLNKIWHLIAGCPVSIAILHEDFPASTLANIYYELGVAQAMGKETVVVKSPAYEVASDLVRSEYIVFDGRFEENFLLFLDELAERADHYEMMAEQLERNPVLSIDYLKRAFLLTNEQGLKERALQTLQSANLQDRAKNSVEVLAASF